MRFFRFPAAIVRPWSNLAKFLFVTVNMCSRPSQEWLLWHLTKLAQTRRLRNGPVARLPSLLARGAKSTPLALSSAGRAVAATTVAATSEAGRAADAGRR